MMPLGMATYQIVSNNPDPVRRSWQSASVVEFLLVKQEGGRHRVSHLARHPRTFPPGVCPKAIPTTV